MPPIPPTEFMRIRQAFGTLEAAAEACGVSIKQVRRWESGDSGVPLAAARLLEILGSRDLGCIEPEWRGWCLRGKTLGSPEGEAFERPWFYAYRYELGARTARERSLRQQVKRLGRLFRALTRIRPRARREPLQLSLTWQASAAPTPAPDSRTSPPAAVCAPSASAAGRSGNPLPRAPTDRRPPRDRPAAETPAAAG